MSKSKLSQSSNELYRDAMHISFITAETGCLDARSEMTYINVETMAAVELIKQFASSAFSPYRYISFIRLSIRKTSLCSRNYQVDASNSNFLNAYKHLYIYI